MNTNPQTPKSQWTDILTKFRILINKIPNSKHMRLYCLTYDAKDYRKAYNKDQNTTDENIKDQIVNELKNLGITHFGSPVASTIIFGLNNVKLNSVDEILVKLFNNKIYYFLCLVAYDAKNQKHFYRSHPDKELEKNFAKSL